MRLEVRMTGGGTAQALMLDFYLTAGSMDVTLYENLSGTYNLCALPYVCYTSINFTFKKSHKRAKMVLCGKRLWGRPLRRGDESCGHSSKY